MAWRGHTFSLLPKSAKNMYIHLSLTHYTHSHTHTDLAEGSWRRESECVLVGRGRQCVQVRERG